MFEPKLNLNDLNLVDEKTMCTVKNSKALYRHMNPTDIPVVFFLKESKISKGNVN